MRRNYTFDGFPQVEEIELEVEYTIWPPNCEVKLIDGWEQLIVNAYMRQAQQAIKSMDDKIMDLEFDNAPAQWMKEDSK